MAEEYGYCSDDYDQGTAGDRSTDFTVERESVKCPYCGTQAVQLTFRPALIIDEAGEGSEGRCLFRYIECFRCGSVLRAFVSQNDRTDRIDEVGRIERANIESGQI